MSAAGQAMSSGFLAGPIMYAGLEISCRGLLAGSTGHKISGWEKCKSDKIAILSRCCRHMCTL